MKFNVWYICGCMLFFFFGCLMLVCVYLGLESAGTFDQAVNETMKEKVAASDSSAPKIRVQKIDDYFIDFGDPERGRASFVISGLQPFGNDKDVLIGLRSDGAVFWQYIGRDVKEKVEKIAQELKNEAAQKN